MKPADIHAQSKSPQLLCQMKAIVGQRTGKQCHRHHCCLAEKASCVWRIISSELERNWTQKQVRASLSLHTGFFCWCHPHKQMLPSVPNDTSRSLPLPHVFIVHPTASLLFLGAGYMTTPRATAKAIASSTNSGIAENSLIFSCRVRVAQKNLWLHKKKNLTSPHP